MFSPQLHSTHDSISSGQALGNLFLTCLYKLMHSLHRDVVPVLTTPTLVGLYICTQNLHGERNTGQVVPIRPLQATTTTQYNHNNTNTNKQYKQK